MRRPRGRIADQNRPGRWLGTALVAGIGSTIGWGVALAVLHAEDSLRQSDPKAPVFLEAPRGPAPGLPRSLADLTEQLGRSIAILSASHPREPNQQVHATGFVISKAGYIVTTDALITRGQDLRAELAGGFDVPLSLIDRDPMTDLALLEISKGVELPPLTPASFGDSDEVRIGEWLLTLGQSDGEAPSLAKGILAGRDRRAAELTASPTRLLQLDMPLLGSFAGGPVIDMEGRVVGIVASPQSPRELGAIGLMGLASPISFALPSNEAKASILRLLERRPKPRVQLGVRIRPTTAAESAAGDQVDGALVEDVIEGSPADGAGLRKGDVIVQYDGREVHGYSDLTTYVALTPAGREVSVVVLRGGDRTAVRALIETAEVSARPQPGRWGFEYAELDAALRARFSLPEDERGIVVTEVSSQSAAWRADLQLGDVVVQIDRTPIRTTAETQRRLARSEVPILLVRRAGTTRFVALEP